MSHRKRARRRANRDRVGAALVHGVVRELRDAVAYAFVDHPPPHVAIGHAIADLIIAIERVSRS